MVSAVSTTPGKQPAAASIAAFALSGIRSVDERKRTRRRATARSDPRAIRRRPADWVGRPNIAEVAVPTEWTGIVHRPPCPDDLIHARRRTVSSSMIPPDADPRTGALVRPCAAETAVGAVVSVSAARLDD